MAHMLKQAGVLLWVVLFCCLAPPCSADSAGSAASMTHARILSPISSPYYPVVLKGEDLPSLLDVPVERIALYAVLDDSLQAIPFQIDRRDRKGRFQIPRNKKEQAGQGRYRFDSNDECVFMAADTGEKKEVFPDVAALTAITEIEVADPKSGQQGWVYALVFNRQGPRKSPVDYVSYDHKNDSIESESYRIAFSKEKPFLMDTLVHKEAGTRRESGDFVDTMKVRHRGKLFHRFDFVRTQQDYTSRLAAVKDGPVRVIRRTENRVRVLWRLKTPVIRIDYLNYANAMFMDTVIDLPFKPGWFFSDMVTLMTVDGNDAPSLPPATLYSRSFPEGVAIDGKMTERKRRFNASGDQVFILSSLYGKILVSMDIEKDSPIQARLYLMDDREIPDPPEEIPGQFGDVGFFSTGWDKLDTASHHLVVRVYLIREISVKQGFEILRDSPSLVN